VQGFGAERMPAVLGAETLVAGKVSLGQPVSHTAV